MYRVKVLSLITVCTFLTTSVASPELLHNSPKQSCLATPIRANEIQPQMKTLIADSRSPAKQQKIERVAEKWKVANKRMRQLTKAEKQASLYYVAAFLFFILYVMLRISGYEPFAIEGIEEPYEQIDRLMRKIQLVAVYFFAAAIYKVTLLVMLEYYEDQKENLKKEMHHLTPHRQLVDETPANIFVLRDGRLRHLPEAAHYSIEKNVAEDLELFSEKVGLFDSLNYSKTFLGSNRIQWLVQNPFSDRAAIENRTEAVKELMASNKKALLQNLLKDLASYNRFFYSYSIEELNTATTQPMDLRSYVELLNVFEKVEKYFKSSDQRLKNPLLQQLEKDLKEIYDVVGFQGLSKGKRGIASLNIDEIIRIPGGGLLLMAFQILLYPAMQRLAKKQAMIERMFENIAELDALCSFAIAAQIPSRVPIASKENPSGLPTFAKLSAEPETLFIEQGFVQNVANYQPTTIRLDRDHSMMLVMGQNMSGKSTLLRMTGQNLIRASIGAPVMAQEMIFSPAQPLSHIHMKSDLENGKSFYVASVEALHQKVAMPVAAGTVAVIFIDELLKGTTSYEEQVAIEQAYILWLRKQAGLKIIATHNQEIADMIVDEKIEGIQLVEFSEQHELKELVAGEKAKRNAVRALVAKGFPSEIIEGVVEYSGQSVDAIPAEKVSERKTNRESLSVIDQLLQGQRVYREEAPFDTLPSNVIENLELYDPAIGMAFFSNQAQTLLGRKRLDWLLQHPYLKTATIQERQQAIRELSEMQVSLQKIKSLYKTISRKDVLEVFQFLKSAPTTNESLWVKVGMQLLSIVIGTVQVLFGWFIVGSEKNGESTFVHQVLQNDPALTVLFLMFSIAVSQSPLMFVLMESSLHSRNQVLIGQMARLKKLMVVSRELEKVLRKMKSPLFLELQQALNVIDQKRKASGENAVKEIFKIHFRGKRLSFDLHRVWGFYNFFLIPRKAARVYQERELFAKVLGAMGDLEALANEAQFYADEPGTVFPEILEPENKRLNVEAGMHHSMRDIPFVPLHVDFQKETAVKIITGENTSGKSTAEKTLGINIVRAQSGASVFAKSMQLSPVRLRTLFDVKDNLGKGLSYYDTELTILKSIVDDVLQQETVVEGKQYEYLVLLDEAPQGTNNADRTAIKYGLTLWFAKQKVFAAIATHDRGIHVLEKNYSELGIENVHFKDYEIRPGVATTTNAISLLEKMGAVPEIVSEAKSRLEKIRSATAASQKSAATALSFFQAA